MQNDLLAQLVVMSNHLGDPALDYVILGEGNTSAIAGGDTYWVKASGTMLRTIDRGGFVRVSFEQILSILHVPSSPMSRSSDGSTKQELILLPVLGRLQTMDCSLRSRQCFTPSASAWKASISSVTLTPQR